MITDFTYLFYEGLPRKLGVGFYVLDFYISILQYFYGLTKLGYMRTVSARGVPYGPPGFLVFYFTG